MAEWPSPPTPKRLQQFLGFANFYRRFIRGYSQVAAPLTALTSTKSAFVWTPKAETAFLDLKKRFVSAPILIQPDPSLQFVVEADASDTPRQLSPPERNYDVSNRKLLAIKLALEEGNIEATLAGGRWRVRSIHLLFGPTTATWPISSQPRD